LSTGNPIVFLRRYIHERRLSKQTNINSAQIYICTSVISCTCTRSSAILEMLFVARATDRNIGIKTTTCGDTNLLSVGTPFENLESPRQVVSSRQQQSNERRSERVTIARDVRRSQTGRRDNGKRAARYLLFLDPLGPGP